MCSCVLRGVSDLMSNCRIKILKQKSPEDEKRIWIMDAYSVGHNAFYGNLSWGVRTG